MLRAILARWRDSRRAWREMQEFKVSPVDERQVVFYAESAADWAYLAPVSSELERQGVRVAKITSDSRDSVLKSPGAFYVGAGFARTALFKTISARAIVMTLPDLETYYLKRSVNPAHYFYVFHSIFSTHCVYQEHAFDAYDTVLCVGPHHFTEIRQTEASYGLKPKRLREHGYGRLDALLRDLGGRTSGDSGTPNVLLAPSWGECSIVAHCLDPLIRSLLQARMTVTVRLHPMTRRYEPDLSDRLMTNYASSGLFQFDPHITATESLLAADVMITDWSGASMDYAFARERPVIFIDTPVKVKNRNYTRIAAQPLEIAIREKIGRVVRLDEIGKVPVIVQELVATAPQWAAQIRKIRDESVVHVGRSGEAGAGVILETLNEKHNVA